MNVKLEDVAVRAGLSKATVSLALNGSDRINARTAQRIVSIAREMGYTPNPYARKLATKKSAQIGLIIPDIENVYYAALVRHLSDALYTSDYDLLISTSENSRGRERKLVRAMIDNRMEGLILAPVNKPNSDPGYLAELSHAGVPTVFSTSKYADMQPFCVMSDLYGGMKQMVTYLHGRGRRRIALVGGPEGVYCLDVRAQGYRDAVAELNLGYERILRVDDLTYERTRRLFDEWERPECDAVICVNDMMALGVINSLLSRGMRVPDDMAVAGYDDVIFSHISPVPITTVRQQIERIAEESAQMALSVIHGTIDPEMPVERSLPCQVVARQST